MCSKAKHIKRSHCTYYRRQRVAAWFCNYHMTKEERMLMRAMMAGKQ